MDNKTKKTKNDKNIKNTKNTKNVNSKNNRNIKKKRRGMAPQGPTEIITYIILLAVAIMLVWLISIPLGKGIGKVYKKAKNSKKTESASPSADVTASPTASEQAELKNLEIYDIVVAEGSTDKTSMTLVFNKKQKMYRQVYSNNGQSEIIDQGTYTKKNGVYKTSSQVNKGNTETFYKKDKYLIVKSQMYDGKVPEGKTFDAKFTYDKNQGYITRLETDEDGTFKMTTSTSMVASKDAQSNSVTGVYEKKGDFLMFETDDSSPMVNFIIHDGKVTNAYYVKEEVDANGSILSDTTVASPESSEGAK
ncbi:MAG: hypothetical protein K6D02_03870 [Lachnospiraceae bacterium]|nr:hypothetical protein [Lachnospiraceae bacterium]